MRNHYRDLQTKYVLICVWDPACRFIGRHARKGLYTMSLPCFIFNLTSTDINWCILIAPFNRNDVHVALDFPFI
jgi:hypothetical protein